ncbi:hypothetical protein QQP08_020979 [Theobroma cacao]|nr:hypothetical protein QQP08_020979 [Theobroma cacao]
MDGSWLLDHKIGMNIARFEGRDAYWKKKYDQIKGNDGNNEVMRQREEKKEERNEELKGESAQIVKKSSAKDVKGEQLACEGLVEKDKLQWLRQSVVGICKSQSKPEIVVEHIMRDGCLGIDVRRWSGRQFIIFFHDKVSFEAVQGLGWVWLGNGLMK